MNFELTDIKYMRSKQNEFGTLFLYKLMAVEKIGGKPYVIYKNWSLSSTEGACVAMGGNRYDGANALDVPRFVTGVLHSLEEITEEEFLLWNIL